MNYPKRLRSNLENLWKKYNQPCTAFYVDRDEVSMDVCRSSNEHIKNIFAEGELMENPVMRKFGNSEFSTHYY
jgi:hypothetical protein